VWSLVLKITVYGFLRGNERLNIPISMKDARPLNHVDE
jgi:hypothetical protein